MIACLQCGGHMKYVREDRKLPNENVVLVNVEVGHCVDCDETEIVIPCIEELRKEIESVELKFAYSKGHGWYQVEDE